MTQLHIGLLVFPRMTQLDMTGPFEVFARIPNANVHLVWKRIEPVMSDKGLTVLPTTTCADCPQLDIICVRAGPGRSTSWRIATSSISCGGRASARAM
jgi:cyclohexyl-isocyanide hydratase